MPGLNRQTGFMQTLGDFDVNPVVLLLEQAIKRATDEDIWSAAFTLVASRATPSTIFNKAPLDTLLKSTPSSQQSSEQTQDEIDPRILQEMNGCVYEDTNVVALFLMERHRQGPRPIPDPTLPDPVVGSRSGRAGDGSGNFMLWEIVAGALPLPVWPARSGIAPPLAPELCDALRRSLGSRATGAAGQGQSLREVN